MSELATGDRSKAAAGCVVALLAAPYLLLRVVIARDMWAWFVEPVVGLGAPGFWVTAGALVFLGMLQETPVSEADREAAERASTGQLLGKAIGAYARWPAGWLIGYLIHLGAS